MEKKMAEVVDSLGRTIVIQKLNALDRMHIFEAIGAELSHNQLWLGYAVSASCVAKINGEMFNLPRKKSDIEYLVQKLGDEGLDAIAKGYAEHFMVGETQDLADVRPLSQTPPSESAAHL
jgi:hypothetical protein